MKIIQRGINWKNEITCSGCNSKLEITEFDVNFENERIKSVNGPRHDWYEDLFYTKCAVCKSKLRLKTLPISIQIFAKNNT